MKVQLRDSCSKANLKRFSRSNMTQNPSWKHQFQRSQKHFVTSKTNKTETSIKYDCEHISKKQHSKPIQKKSQHKYTRKIKISQLSKQKTKTRDNSVKKHLKQEINNQTQIFSRNLTT